VRLPLFHRLGAGIAKEKIKVKARESHVFQGFAEKFRLIVQ
jgi:hypothetical protein